MNKFVDPLAICIYCGDTMPYPNERQMEVFGIPNCCGFDMLPIERDKIHTIVRSLDTLKKNLEQELLEGML